MTVKNPIKDEDVVRILGSLVESRPSDGGWEVRTPLLFPSGASLSVGVGIVTADTLKVSDLGAAFREAYAGDVANSFARAAKELAEEFGIHYERRHLSIPQVSLSNLGAAVKLVANCSQASVMLAIERANERRPAFRMWKGEPDAR